MKRLSLLLVLALFSCSKEPVMYDVTTSVTEGGTVSPQSGSYEEGSTVTITATPSTEYEFTKWSNGSTQNPLVLTVTSDLNIQATFTKKQYELNISKEGEGTVSERVINTGKGYDSGTKVELTAVPAGEWVFAGWSGDFTSNDNPIQVTISSPKNIKAKFVKRKYPLTINIEGEGTVTEEIVNTGRTTEYDSGTTVRLTAQPSEGWKFEKWIGDIESTDESIEMNIVEPLGVTAIFIKQSNQVSITIIGNGKINNIIEDYSIELVQGETVELAALSINDQSIFLGWSGDVLTSSNPLILSTETNMNLTANFLSKDEIQGLVITGQGEIKLTPLQMANIAVIIANKGWYYSPHFVKSIGKKGPKANFRKKNKTMVESKYFDAVIEGMRRVVNESGGTAKSARLEDIIICGKTGTVQNPHGKDHSVFIAFAPRDNPKIAIAVIVENSGFGATWSAPIASLLVEKYLRDSITRPQAYMDRISNASLLPAVAKPITKPKIDTLKAKLKAKR